MPNTQILLVENDESYARVAKDTLEASDIECVVTIAPLLVQALKSLKRRWYNVILLELDLPDSSGLDTLAAVNSAWPRIPILALVGPEYEDRAEVLLKSGAKACLFKPSLDKQQMVAAVKNVATVPNLSKPHFKQQSRTESRRRPTQ